MRIPLGQWEIATGTASPRNDYVYRLTALPPYRLTALPPYRLTALPPYRLTALPTVHLTALPHPPPFPPFPPFPPPAPPARSALATVGASRSRFFSGCPGLANSSNIGKSRDRSRPLIVPAR